MDTSKNALHTYQAMLWFALALGSALAQTGKFVANKHFLDDLAPLQTAWATMTGSLLFLLPVQAFLGIPQLEEGFWTALAVGIIVNSTTIVLVMRALNTTDVGLVAPLLTFSPVFLLLTAPFLLGEIPTVAGLAGILLVLTGAYVINSTDAPSMLAPITRIWTDPGQRYILFAAMLWAVSSAYFKLGMQASSTFFYLTCFQLGVAVVLTTALLILRKEFATPSTTAILGLTQAAALLFQWSSAMLTQVVYALSVKRFSAPFSVIAGNTVFQEEHLATRLAGAFLMVIGAIAIGLYG